MTFGGLAPLAEQVLAGRGWERREPGTAPQPTAPPATLPEDLHPQQPRVRQADIDWLEADMDRRNATLPTLRSFVLPGGHRANVDLHLCRTVCRRAERLCVTLARTQGVDPMCVPYLNRLSDLMFVLARVLNRMDGGDDVYWKSERLKNAT